MTRRTFFILVLAALGGVACRAMSLPSAACSTSGNCYANEVCCNGQCVKPALSQCADAGGADAGADAGMDAGADGGGLPLSCGSNAGTIGLVGSTERKPHAVLDERGNVWVVWARGEGPNNQILFSTYIADAGAFTPDDTVSENPGAHAEPTVGAGAGGRVAVVWIEADGGGASLVRARTSIDGGAWSATASLAGAAIDAGHPRIAFDTLGNATTVWRDMVGAGPRVVSSRWGATSGAWEDASVVASAASGELGEPTIVAMANGTALAIWAARGPSPGVFASRRALDAGTWGGIETLQVTTESPYAPAAVADDAGNVTVAWWQSNFAQQSASVWTNRFVSATGLWADAGSVMSTDAGPDLSFALGGDTLGNAITLASLPDLFSRSTAFTSPGNWASARLVSQSGLRPSVVVTSDGTTFVAFEQEGAILVRASPDLGATWTAATTISVAIDAGTTRSGSPTVLANSANRIVVVWVQQIEATYEVWGRTCP